MQEWRVGIVNTDMMALFVLKCLNIWKIDALIKTPSTTPQRGGMSLVHTPPHRGVGHPSGGWCLHERAVGWRVAA
jgi:hypothetical protein